MPSDYRLYGEESQTQGGVFFMPCNSRQGELHMNRGNLGPLYGCVVLLVIVVVLGLIGAGIYVAIVGIPQVLRQNNEQASYSATATAFAPYSNVLYSATNATLSGGATITYESGQGGVTLTHNGGSVTFNNVSVPQTGSYHLIAWGNVSSATFDITVNGTLQDTSTPNLPSDKGGDAIQLNAGNNTITLSVSS